MKNKAMLWRFTAQYAWPHRWALGRGRSLFARHELADGHDPDRVG